MDHWARLRRILSLSCEEAAELSSRRLDEPLSWADKLAWAGHLLVCRSCRRFRQQLTFLRQAVRHIAAIVDDPPPAEAGLSEAARTRITKAIRDAAP